jgi:hypothetical protein
MACITCRIPASEMLPLPSLTETIASSFSQSFAPVVIRLLSMPNHNRVTQEPPVKSGGEGWLVNGAQKLLVQFKPDTPSTQGQWVSLRTYAWEPPHPPEPQSRRRMLRHTAIEAWETMLKTGWRRCSPPVH